MTTRIARLMNQPFLMRRRTPLLLLSLLVPLAAGAARAELVVHVSPAGDDAWSGGLTSPNADRTDGPVAGRRRARDRVRELRAAGARPVISGGRRITGLRPGTGADAGLWVVDLPQHTPWRFEQLFVNGRRAVRAREPDVGTFAVVAAEEIPLDASGQPLSAEARDKLGPKGRPPRADAVAAQTVSLSAGSKLPVTR